MRKLLRVGMIAASLAGLAGTLAPTPADATTEGSIAINGTATVHGHGIAYPLIDSDGPTGPNGVVADPSKAPPNFGNSASVTFGSTTCAAAVTNVMKAGKPPAEAGLCAVAAGGTVHGYCGLSDGHISGTVTVNVVGSGTQVYSFHLSWGAAVGGALVLSGHWHKHGTTHSGVLKGLVTAVPDATAGTCTNKFQKNFLVNGDVTLASTTSGTSTSLPPKPSLKSPPSCSPPC
jgi:hypothetical protein